MSRSARRTWVGGCDSESKMVSEVDLLLKTFFGFFVNSIKSEASSGDWKPLWW